MTENFWKTTYHIEEEQRLIKVRISLEVLDNRGCDFFVTNFKVDAW